MNYLVPDFKLINSDFYSNKNSSMLSLVVVQPPVFTETPSDMNVREGESTELTCKAIGRPMPKITWYYERQMISQDKHIKLTDQAETADCQSSVLALTDLLPTKHAGKYTMEAVNEVGSVKHTMMLSGILGSHLTVDTH